MAGAYLHRCASYQLPLNLVSARLEELDQQGQNAACQALRAEFEMVAGA